LQLKIAALNRRAGQKDAALDDADKLKK